MSSAAILGLLSPTIQWTSSSQISNRGRKRVKIEPLSAIYSKYDELLEVKVATIVVLLELCIRFFASQGVGTIIPYQHSVPDWYNIVEWGEYLMNSGNNCAEELWTCQN